MTSKISEVYDMNSQLFALQLGGAALTTTILQLNDYFTCNNFFGAHCASLDAVDLVKFKTRGNI